MAYSGGREGAGKPFLKQMEEVTTFFLAQIVIKVSPRDAGHKNVFYN